MVKGKDTDTTWQHCQMVHEGNKQTLRCNYCAKIISGGVFRMKHHLARTKKNVVVCTQNPDDVAQMFKALLGEKEKARGDRADDLLDIMELEEEEERNERLAEYRARKRKAIGGSTTTTTTTTGSSMGSTMMGSTMDKFIKKGKKILQTTLNEAWKKDEREKVCEDICRCLYANALSFNLVKSPFFKTMLDSVSGYGKGLKPPSYHEVRNTFLEQEVVSVTERLHKYKVQWSKTGCTVMSDGWTDRKRRSITNFLVNSPKGTIFLKSVDTSSIIKNADNLFAMLDEVIEDIGEENVVQVVTDSTAAYVRAGELLMMKRKQLYWSPCAAHCIDLILEDLGKLPTHKSVVEKCRCITVYIYKHSWVLNLMRTYTKGRELTRPAVTRFATQYLTLSSIMAQRGALRWMLTSTEWEGSSYGRSIEGKKVFDIILTDITFWDAIRYCIKSTLPLVKVLRLVDGDAKPAMGYIYEAMDRAKEQIAQNFGRIKKRYEMFWNIIDERWNLQLHRPLHAAGYYLNPRFRYEDTFQADIEVKRGLYDCIERMVPDRKKRILIDRQLDMFSSAEGGFGRDMAMETRKTKQPALWWESYGYDTLELQRFAIRVLSLTCKATGCERNWSVFDQTLDIIWNQAGASDDYVPYLEVCEGNNFFPSRHCDKKQCLQGVSGEDILKDKNDLCGLKVKNSWFQENDEITGLGLGLDFWSDLHPSSTEEIGWDTIWTEKSNDVTDATNFNLIQGEADLFGNGNEDRASHSFLGFSWANVSNFDDLDTTFRNDDSIIGHEMIGSADELWPSSVVAKGINNSLKQSCSTAASSLSSYFEETRSTTKWHNGKTECVPSKNQPFNLEMDKINNLISGSPHEVSPTEDEGAEFVNQTEASTETTAETTATQSPQSNKITGSCNNALEKVNRQIKLVRDEMNELKVSQNNACSHMNQFQQFPYTRMSLSGSNAFPSSVHGTVESQSFLNASNPYAHAGSGYPKNQIPALMEVHAHTDSCQSALDNYKLHPGRSNDEKPKENLPNVHSMLEKLEKLKMHQETRKIFTIQSQQNFSLLQKSGAGRKGQQENQHWLDDSIKTSMLIDGSSLAESVLDQLQAAIKLDNRTRLCIRDSLFRLANSAVQRHSFCSTNRTNNIGKDRIDRIADEEGNSHDRLTRLSDTETDTNPIDRTMVHLLYCMPADPSVTLSVKDRCPEFPIPGSHKEVPIQPKTENCVGPGALSQPESSSVKQSMAQIIHFKCH